jgi:Mg-chelatase subunit ChlD
LKGGDIPGGANVTAAHMVRNITNVMTKLKLADASGASPDKDVMFVLDYSGSMAGGRIQRSIENMLVVFDEHCKDNDHIAFIRFNERVETVFELTRRPLVNRQLIQRSVTPEGGTAFFDALANGLTMMSASLRAKRFVIALTDGEDNSSVAVGPRYVRDAASGESDRRMAICVENLKPRITESGVTLIVVGVGLAPRFGSMLRDLCSASTSGLFIDVSSDSADKLKDAFAKVSKLIQGHNLSLEAF